MESRRILLVGHSPDLHGAEYSLLRLAQELKNRFKLSVLAPAGGPFEKAIQQLGLEFFAFEPCYPFGLIRENKCSLSDFTRQFSRETQRLLKILPKFDLVHSNTLYVWEGAALAAHWGVPHIWNLREIPQASPTWRPALGWTRTFQLLHALSDSIVCVSQALIQALPEPLRSQSAVIHNGLDAPSLMSREESRRLMRDWGVPDGAKVALTVGNFIPEKGHAQLLELVKDLLKKYTEWHLLWVGEQHFCYPELRQKIEALGLSSRIHCPGAVSQMGQKMSAADLYLLPSLTEAFPTVLLEARCAQVPFLANDCGGAREIAAQGGGECWHSLEEARQKLEVAFKGQWHVSPIQVQAFSMQHMGQAYGKIYERWLEQELNADLVLLRRAEIATLLELEKDLNPVSHLQQKVARLKSLRALGRFFRWYFKL